MCMSSIPKCGTYAVRDPAGLLVLPRKPKNVSGRDHGYTSSLKRLPSPSRPSHDTSPQLKRPKKYESAVSAPQWWTKSFSDPPLPYELEYGRRVQVVTIEDGWVKLARNMGFLYVDSNQLVKVSGPTDKACEIEALLIDVEKRKVDSSKQLFEMNRTEAGLHAALDNALNQPSPACVNNFQLDLRDGKENSVPPKETPKKINCAKKKENIENIPLPSLARSSPEPQSYLKKKSNFDVCTSAQAYPQKQYKCEIRTPPQMRKTHFADASTSFLSPLSHPKHPNLGIPKLSPATSSHSIKSDRSNSSLSGLSASSSEVKLNVTNKRRSPRDSRPSRTIDFRTGLSGHSGLSKKSAHLRTNLRQEHGIQHMSNHNAIGTTKSNGRKN